MYQLTFSVTGGSRKYHKLTLSPPVSIATMLTLSLIKRWKSQKTDQVVIQGGHGAQLVIANLLDSSNKVLGRSVSWAASLRKERPYLSRLERMVLETDTANSGPQVGPPQYFTSFSLTLRTQGFIVEQDSLPTRRVADWIIASGVQMRPSGLVAVPPGYTQWVLECPLDPASGLLMRSPDRWITSFSRTKLCATSVSPACFPNQLWKASKWHEISYHWLLLIKPGARHTAQLQP